MPNILIVYSHGGLNEKIVETGGFYNTKKVSGYKKLKEYHVVAAVCGSKVIVLGSNTYHVLEASKNVQSTSDESCIGPNATVVFKAIHEFNNDSLNMKVKYISNQLEKSNVDESAISDITNKLEIYIDDLRDEVNSELKREDVMIAIQGLKFGNSMFKKVLASMSKQYGYNCCVLEFGSVDQFLNLTTSKSLSRVSVTTSSQKQTIVFTFSSITMVIDILEMGTYLFGLHTPVIKSECIIFMKLFTNIANKLL